MITAIFNPGDKSITTKKVMQWDYGQVLSIKGLDLPKAVEIHFCVYTDSTTIPVVGITTDDHTDVEIPDGLLRQDRELRAYVYVADMEQGKTVRTVNIPIQSRQKPEIPHTPEDTEIFREAIKAVNNSADRAETAANTSDQNAKKTAEDRTAIEEMVETVSGIEQQVQDVKKYAGQAETAASNAALSEQEAKKSENAALQAKADAETAKGSAETAAGKTAEDRTTVESAKEEVLQAKQQVSTDRAAVEAVERKVAQMGNAIPQAVQAGVRAVGSAGAAEKQGIVQAGTEQKSDVESAGTKAVEDINLAKKTATDAVETAKTGAIKTVEDKGAEVLQSIPEDFTTQMASKLDKQQGAENKGKALVVGNDGNVTVGEVQGGDGIPIINTMSGESPLVVPDSAERVNKGFSIIGNTTQNQDPPPSPDNLQEIKNVGKWNEAKQKYDVDVKVTGKNIIDDRIESWQQGGYSPTGEYESINYRICLKRLIRIKNTEQIFLDTGNNNYTFVIRSYDKYKKFARSFVDITANKPITLLPNEEYISVSIQKTTATQINLSEFNDMRVFACYFGMNNSYSEYTEQTITLTSDRPITKWDRLVEQGGQIGWLYQSAINEYRGDASIAIYQNGFCFLLNNKKLKSGEGYCEELKQYVSREEKPCINFNMSPNTYAYTLNTQAIYGSTTSAIKEYLKTHPLHLVYKTETTEFVPLPQSEQNAIRALKTYYPTTVITTDGGEVDPDVEVTYIADTKNYIDQKIAAIGKTVVETQKALL